jgi:hypothetical protein
MDDGVLAPLLVEGDGLDRIVGEEIGIIDNPKGKVICAYLTYTRRLRARARRPCCHFVCGSLDGFLT